MMSAPMGQQYLACDPVGTFPGLEHDPLVLFARDFCRDRLAPSAPDVDRNGVVGSVLASMGPLLGMAAGADLGGSAATPAQWREVNELIMGADGTTWFCWSQHHPLVRTIAAALPYLGEHARFGRELLSDLVAGRAISAISFSHVRKPGAPALTATPVADGWSLAGRVDWVTAWDVSDVVLVMAEHEGKLIHLVVDTIAQPGLQVGEPLDLMAMSGSHTRPVAFDGVVVPRSRVVGVLPKASWLATDERITAQPNPAALGVARAAVASIAATAAARNCERTAEAGEALALEVRGLRTRSYAALDDASTPVAELLSLRSAGLALATRAAAAALTARGGRALMAGDEAERRYREAAFLLVQRQTAMTRLASLDAWAIPMAGADVP